MSEIRRKLLIKHEESGDKFAKVIQAINSLSGEKSFLQKFDDSLFVWVLTYTAWSTTSHILHVFDLEGNELASLSHASKKHTGAVIDNYVALYDGTNDRSIPLSVFYFNGSSISKVKTLSSVRNWTGGGGWYAYKDTANHIHFCSYSNSGRFCVFDYDFTNNSFNRTESTYNRFVSWYNYDRLNFRGLLWSYASGQLMPVSYIKSTSTTNRYTASSYIPNLSNYYCAFFMPLFDYDDANLLNLLYEMFAGYKNAQTSDYMWHNVLGLENPEPTQLTLGSITVQVPGLGTATSPYGLMARGAISFVENGVLHMYSYNNDTKLIDLVM